MNILFITDPLESLKIHKDSTFSMMREAQRRGFQISACEPKELVWQSGGRVSAQIKTIQLTGHTPLWFNVQTEPMAALADVDAVLMRKDPPFDTEFLYATHLLEQAEREGAKVFNRPRALRDHSEKLAIMEFQSLIAPTLVSRDAQHLKDFHRQYGDIILKPLDGMGGMGIFRVGPDGLNLGSIIESLTDYGTQTVMAQKYLPAITQGDKRILLIQGEPVPYALARIPQNGEVRGNIAAGGKGVAQALSPRDLEIACSIGPDLAARGLLLVGLDVIGEHLTEINVGSPTCFQEITAQTDCDVTRLFVDMLEKML